MTGRAGIARSLIFPAAEPARNEPPADQPKPREPRTKAKPPADPPAEQVNVVLCFGDLVRDSRTVQEKLEYLLGDVDHFGGNCRAILNLLRHMQRNVEVLINHHEEA